MKIDNSMFMLAIFPSLWASGVAAESYTIDPRHTFPSFEVSHIGFSTQRGRFNQTSGKISLDAQAKSGHIEVAIDSATIDTGLEELEARLKKDDFFNTAKYPGITFKSDKLEFTGNKPVSAEGTLTMLGVSQPLRLKIDHFHCGTHPISLREVCGADASGAIKRSDFGLKAFLPAVGDEVSIRIQVEALKD